MSSSWKYQNLKKWIENGCPDEFKGIQPKKDIQSLYCSNNQLTSLPAEIGLLTNLRVLYCSSNELASLPAEIGSLTNLQNLYCNNNQLTSVLNFDISTDLKRIQISHRLIWDFRADKTFTTHWSGCRVQV